MPNCPAGGRRDWLRLSHPVRGGTPHWGPVGDRTTERRLMTGETIMHILGGLSLAGLVFWAWKTIPPENPDIVEARKLHGKVPK